MIAHAEEIREIGLTIRSIHFFAKNPAGQVELLKKIKEVTDLAQIVVKPPTSFDLVSLEETAISLMAAADAMAPFGINVLIHNEGKEIAAKVSGMEMDGHSGNSVYEYLVDRCQGKVFMQVDAGWVMIAGEDPLAFLRRNVYRVKSIHFKDFLKGAMLDDPHDVTIGTGALDVAGIFRFAVGHRIPMILDQEHYGSDIAGDLGALHQMLNGYAAKRGDCVSFLHTYDIVNGEVKTLAKFNRVIEAPNWLKTQNAMLFNSEGRIWRYDLATGRETLIDTGVAQNVNNDHVVSPDETEIAVSEMTAGKQEGEPFSSRIFIAPIDGGEARLVIDKSPSFLHGWSPDGTMMAYCGFRGLEDGGFAADVYTVEVPGPGEEPSTEEFQLTTGGYNDGCEYSPDGHYIWYHSTKNGLMQVWRMKADGSKKTQLTTNHRNNWFPHISPDNQKVVYISYGADQLEPHEHLPNMPVELWMMNADGSDQRKIVSLWGGQGTINVNSWDAESRRFAFVSYAV